MRIRHLIFFTFLLNIIISCKEVNPNTGGTEITQTEKYLPSPFKEEGIDSVDLRLSHVDILMEPGITIRLRPENSNAIMTDNGRNAKSYYVRIPIDSMTRDSLLSYVDDFYISKNRMTRSFIEDPDHKYSTIEALFITIYRGKDIQKIGEDMSDIYKYGELTRTTEDFDNFVEYIINIWASSVSEDAITRIMNE